MYRIYSDDNLIYDPRVPDRMIVQGTLSLELNKSGMLKFELPSGHPHINDIRLMKSVITVKDDEKLIFRGRPYSPTVDLLKESVFECEGELAFFNDTYFAPFQYFGDVETLFRAVVLNHNAQVDETKQFVIGDITVRNKTEGGNISRSSQEYLSSWEVLKSKFFGSALGGYLRTRHENGVVYIDYLEDFDETISQSLEQTVNVIDASKEINPDTLATVILPLGARIQDSEGQYTGERVTIAGVNGGIEYLEDAEGVSIYGRIARVVIHNDITIPQNLLTAGRADLQNALGVSTTYNIRAVDLSKAGYNVASFMLGKYVPVKVPNVGAAQRMLIRKMFINLLEPSLNTIETGAENKSLTANLMSIDELQTSVAQTSQSIAELERRTEKAIEQAKEETSEEIQTTAEAIRTETTEEIGTSITPLEIIAPKTITLNGIFAGKLQNSVLKFTIPIGKTIRDIATTDIAITGEIRVVHSTGAETITLADLSYVTYDTMISVVMATELTLADQPVSVEPTTEITIAFMKGS